MQMKMSASVKLQGKQTNTLTHSITCKSSLVIYQCAGNLPHCLCTMYTMYFHQFSLVYFFFFSAPLCMGAAYVCM